MTNTSMLSTLLSLQATKAMMAAGPAVSDYKAIVCLFLFGGIDSYNMLTPYDGTGEGDASDPNNPNITGEYGDYYRVRGGFDDNIINPGGLALEKSTLTQINDPTTGRNFGLHPGLSADADPAKAGLPADQRGVAGLYNAGKIGWVNNVGSLIKPTTKADYDARRNLPVGLFSHADLQRHWMTSVPQSRNHLTGWGGRLAECFADTNGEDTVSMSISIAGVNLFQAGGLPYAIGQNGATQVSNYYAAYNSGNYQDNIFSKAVDNMLLNQTYNDLLEQSFADTHYQSIEAAIDFNNAISAVPINTEFADEGLSNRFKTIAKVIAAAGKYDTLAQDRQIFFIAEGGWDNHGNVLPAQQAKLPVVSRAMASFHAAMEEHNLQDQVLLFCASDFARTLGTNGQGSDHAWGGNYMVMGGGVDGGKMYGTYPSSLAGGNPLDTGRGRLIPTTSVDAFAADIAMWFGLSNNDLPIVLPNIREFHDSATPPLGFMA